MIFEQGFQMRMFEMDQESETGDNFHLKKFKFKFKYENSLLVDLVK